MVFAARDLYVLPLLQSPKVLLGGMAMRRPEDLPSYRKTRMIQRNKAVKSQFVALSTLFIPNKPLRYLEKPPYPPTRQRLVGLANQADDKSDACPRCP